MEQAGRQIPDPNRPLLDLHAHGIRRTAAIPRRQLGSGKHLYRSSGWPQRPGDPGQACPRAARHRAHPVLLAGGARPHGAGLRHAAEPAAAGAAPGRDHDARRRPTASSPSASWPTTTPASRSPRPSPAAPSWPTRAIWPRSCACRSSAWSATTTASATRASCLQIPPHRHRHHFVKVKVRVHAYEDGRLAVFHGPRCLARYQTRRAPCVRGDHQTRRLSPLGGAPGGFAGQRFALPTTPPGQQQQRTFDVLRKPDIFTCH